MIFICVMTVFACKYTLMYLDILPHTKHKTSTRHVMPFLSFELFFSNPRRRNNSHKLRTPMAPMILTIRNFKVRFGYVKVWSNDNLVFAVSTCFFPKMMQGLHKDIKELLFIIIVTISVIVIITIIITTITVNIISMILSVTWLL